MPMGDWPKDFTLPKLKVQSVSNAYNFYSYVDDPFVIVDKKRWIIVKYTILDSIKLVLLEGSAAHYSFCREHKRLGKE